MCRVKVNLDGWLDNQIDRKWSERKFLGGKQYSIIVSLAAERRVSGDGNMRRMSQVPSTQQRVGATTTSGLNNLNQLPKGSERLTRLKGVWVNL